MSFKICRKRDNTPLENPEIQDIVEHRSEAQRVHWEVNRWQYGASWRQESPFRSDTAMETVWRQNDPKSVRVQYHFAGAYDVVVSDPTLFTVES